MLRRVVLLACLLAKGSGFVLLSPPSTVRMSSSQICRGFAPEMFFFKQIMDDFKVAQDANRYEAPRTEPVPPAVSKRAYARAAHILVDTEDDALAVQAKIEAGELTFEDAAKQFSKCKTRGRGGDLDAFKSLAKIMFLPYTSQFSKVAAFDELVFSSATDLDVIHTVQTEFGFHLVKVFDRDISSSSL
jgi:parvulin-like peptidyl-prolyl isomerase